MTEDWGEIVFPIPEDGVVNSEDMIWTMLDIQDAQFGLTEFDETGNSWESFTDLHLSLYGDEAQRDYFRKPLRLALLEMLERADEDYSPFEDGEEPSAEEDKEYWTPERLKAGRQIKRLTELLLDAYRIWDSEAVK